MKSRHFLLYVKRHGIKFEVYQKGSLFRSDRLLGTAEIKLLGLESKTEVHESLDVNYLNERKKPKKTILMSGFFFSLFLVDGR